MKGAKPSVSGADLFRRNCKFHFHAIALHSAGIFFFPNEASLLRLTSALLCEINEEWLTGKSYLNMNPADLPQN